MEVSSFDVVETMKDCADGETVLKILDRLCLMIDKFPRYELLVATSEFLNAGLQACANGLEPSDFRKIRAGILKIILEDLPA